MQKHMTKNFIKFGAALLAAVFLMAGGFSKKAYALTEEDSAWLAQNSDAIAEAREALAGIAASQPVLGLVYLCDTYPVRVEASYDSEAVLTVPSGQSVLIEDAVIAGADDGLEVWEYVRLYYNDQEYQGYIPRSYLACSDERFLQWEEEYGMNPGGGAAAYAARDVELAQFPDSYQESLRKLKEQHPNWTFVAMDTGLDWNTVIANEIGGGKSLVHKSLADCTKEGSYDNSSWYYASEEILKYYMDPRNGLTEDGIFQFEHLVYNESHHNMEALENFLNNTFMNSSQNAPRTDLTYATIFWAVGVEQKVSPYHLAARVRQEQGNGDSALISGTYTGYEGYYNYFNIGATGNSDRAYIENGLSHARANGWDSAYTSIRGGAIFLAGNYINRGQDTLYLQKFNVTTNNTYEHQYMQNISAPASEGRNMWRIYSDSRALDSPFVFRIPVYRNMPEAGCAMPASSTNVVVKIPSGYDTTVYLDGAAYSPAVRNGRHIVTAPNGEAGNAVVYKYNANGIPIGMYVWTLEYKNNAYAVTEQPQLENLLTYHGFSIRITGKSGIRFKTGISTDLRGSLVSGGVDGYVLKEYGTLVMNNANRNQYPMIKGGEKVLDGRSYGMNENGALDDKIYEIVDNRYRFTSVLVGLPAGQYRTEYAFRGYAILEKDGKQTVVYGPIIAKSIYSLAEQVLNMGTYSQGSEADLFLRKLISDGDAAGQ